jgi:hypothetical protein
VLGLVGVACTTASAPVMPIWGFPGTSASPAVIVRFVTTHHDRLLAGMMLNIAGVVLWTVLGAGVWRRVRTAAEPTDPATACLAAGLVGFVTLILTGFAVFTVFVARLPDPRFARLMYDLTFGLLAISGAPTAVCLVGFAVVAWRTACFPRATIGIAIVAAAAHVVLVFSLVVPSGFFSLDGQIITAAPATLFTWLAACAVVLLGRYDPVQVLAPHLLGRHHDDSRR